MRAVALGLLALLAAAPSPAGDWTARMFPEGDPYPLHLADPHRPGLGVVLQSVTEIGVNDSGESRFFLRAGGRYGLVELVSPAGRRFQIATEVGFDAVFDRDRGYDGIGWDGNYGLVLTGPLGATAFRVGALHTSAHVGDEFAERTGRRRLRYTREELLAAVAIPVAGRLTGYLEGAVGYDLRNEEIQEPGRAQAGLQYLSGPRWRGRWGWYWALDLQAMEELDWGVDTAAQLGFTARSGDQRWRLGLELIDGRVPLGEFYGDEETAIGLGLWLDPSAGAEARAGVRAR